MADALVMCGGRGARLRESVDGTAGGAVEKPLFPVAGTPMVERVVAALAGAAPIGTVHAAVSPSAPDTRQHLREYDIAPRRDADGDATVTLVETEGAGYVTDLTAALDDPRVTRPVVTAVADLPLLASDAVAAALSRADGGERDLAVCVPVALKEALGVSVDRTLDRAPGDVVGPAAGRVLAPTGLNVVGVGGEVGGGADGADGTTTAGNRVHAGWDARLAVNVNYAADAAVAGRLAAGADGGDAGGSR